MVLLFLQVSSWTPDDYIQQCLSCLVLLFCLCCFLLLSSLFPDDKEEEEKDEVGIWNMLRVNGQFVLQVLCEQREIRTS